MVSPTTSDVSIKSALMNLPLQQFQRFPAQRARGHLDHDAPGRGHGDAPRPQVAHHFHRVALAIDEDELNFRKSGILALQLHSGKPMRIEVKDIRIRELTKRGN